MADDHPQETKLTREELYDRVWSEPVATLAPKFGISDVGLKKACTRMRVPTPSRGYWAKKAAGLPVRRTPLPKLPASAGTAAASVTFHSRSAPSQTELQTGRVADQARYEADPEHAITVPEILTDPHPLVALSVKALRNEKADAQHRLVLPRARRCLAVNVTLGTVDRAMCMYHALITALEARGYRVDVSINGETCDTTVQVREERVGLCIEERVDRTERPPDARDKRRSFYGPQYDYTPTGRLKLFITDSYLGVRRSWSDATKQRLEECLNDVVVGVVRAAEALREQRLQREARQREWAAAEERRQLAEQRRREEASRVRALEAGATAWRWSVTIREFVASMRSSAGDALASEEYSGVAQWLDWAEEYASRLDPARALPRLPADPSPYQWAPPHDHSTSSGIGRAL